MHHEDHFTIAAAALLCGCSVLSSGPVGSLIDADLAKAKRIADASGDAPAASCYAAMIQHRQITAGVNGLFSALEAGRAQKAVVAACAVMVLP